MYDSKKITELQKYFNNISSLYNNPSIINAMQLTKNTRLAVESYKAIMNIMPSQATLELIQMQLNDPNIRYLLANQEKFAKISQHSKAHNSLNIISSALQENDRFLDDDLPDTTAKLDTLQETIKALSSLDETQDIEELQATQYQNGTSNFDWKWYVMFTLAIINIYLNIIGSSSKHIDSEVLKHIDSNIELIAEQVKAAAKR